MGIAVCAFADSSVPLDVKRGVHQRNVPGASTRAGYDEAVMAPLLATGRGVPFDSRL